MLLSNPKDAIHKAWLYRLLSAIADDEVLARLLFFKGGTCAAMLGYLDRFSVDLDFDFVGGAHEVLEARRRLERIYQELGLMIKDKSKMVPQYFLGYSAKEHERNTIKLDVTFPHPLANKYEAKTLVDIDRIMYCQTIETMFGNKLVALIDRFEKHGSIAGRDVYDIHAFFLQGFRYDIDVIEERRGKSIQEVFSELLIFVDKNITDTIINQDLNRLLSKEKFQKIRKVLKQEVLMFLRDEIVRVEQKSGNR